MMSVLLLCLAGASAAFAQDLSGCSGLQGCKACLGNPLCTYAPANNLCFATGRKLADLTWTNITSCPTETPPLRSECLTYNNCKDCITKGCAWGNQVNVTDGMSLYGGKCYYRLTCPGLNPVGVTLCFRNVTKCPANAAGGVVSAGDTAPTLVKPISVERFRPVVRPMPIPQAIQERFGCPPVKPALGAPCSTAVHNRLCPYDEKCNCTNVAGCVMATEAMCKDDMWFVSTNPSKCLQA